MPSLREYSMSGRPKFHSLLDASGRSGKLEEHTRPPPEAKYATQAGNSGQNRAIEVDGGRVAAVEEVSGIRITGRPPVGGRRSQFWINTA